MKRLAILYLQPLSNVFLKPVHESLMLPLQPGRFRERHGDALPFVGFRRSLIAACLAGRFLIQHGVNSSLRIPWT